MAIHKKNDASGRAVARVLLESREPVELPPATINEQSSTFERPEFQPYLPELCEAIRLGGRVLPVPLVQSDSLFIIHGQTRTFWVRLWHSDQSRTVIDRLHVVNCLSRAGNIQLHFGA